ncbi:ABC transporter permease [Sphingomonas sp. LR61]|uniref:ABC transporter permease n=1 Tax=Sphingomonas sp. LR61 TaxID=3050234 RepID=UPI002FE13319
MVGVAATLIGGGTGVVLGVVAGLGAGAGRVGRLLDAVIGRVTEVAFALPLLLVALVVIAVTGPGPVPAVLAVGFATAPGYARIVRGLVRAARSSQVVETAVLLGRSPVRIVVRHVLPTALWPVVAVATLGVGQAIVWASALSYLGVGTPPPAPEWGAMLADGRTYLQTAPWMSTFPGSPSWCSRPPSPCSVARSAEQESSDDHRPRGPGAARRHRGHADRARRRPAGRRR